MLGGQTNHESSRLSDNARVTTEVSILKDHGKISNAGESSRQTVVVQGSRSMPQRLLRQAARAARNAVVGLVGSQADATMEGLASGLNCLTPTRSIIIYAGLAFVLIYVSLVPTLDSWGFIGPAIVTTNSVQKGVLYFKVACLLFACAGSLTFVAVCAVPASRPLAMRVQGRVGGVIFQATLAQGTLSYFIYEYNWKQLATWVSAVCQPAIFATAWGFLLATSPQTEGWRIFHAAFATVYLAAAQMFVEVNAYGWMPRSWARMVVAGLTNVVISWLFDTLLSARDGARDSKKRLRHAESARMQAVRRAGSGGRAMDGAPGAPQGWAGRVALRAREWWRRTAPWLAHISDVDQFRVIFLLWWLLIVVLTCYGTYAMAGAIWTPEPHAFVQVVEPLAALLSALLSFGLGVRFARVLVANREEVLANIVPVDVAQAIVQQHNMRLADREEGSRDGARGGGFKGRDKKSMQKADVATGRRTSVSQLPSALAGGDAFYGVGALPAPSDCRDNRGAVEIVMPWQGVARDGLRPSRRLSVVAGHPLEPPPDEESLVFAEELTYYKEFEDISMVFSDLVGFTTFAQRVHPQTALMALHSIFSVLDKVVGTLKGHKYETVGDAYIGAFNMVRRDTNHALTAVIMGCTLVRVVSSTFVHCPGHESINLAARVGIHCGPAAGGVLGTKRSVLQLVGDTLNTASRMESHGIKNHVQVTEAVFRRLPEGVQRLFRAREVDVKGKGHMTTYVLDVLGEPEVAALGLDLLASRESWERVMREGAAI